MESLGERWGAGRFIIAPTLATDASVREWAQRLQINAATPGAAESFMRMAFDIDVRSVVPTISVPTLIVHRPDDSVCHVENGRFLARHIPGAVYVELPGGDHAPWAAGNAIVAEIREFLTGVREPAEPERVLATMVFTDIVGSTERAAALGDERWRALLDSHDRVVRDELRRFRGREVNTTGDGFVASFDGTARALRAAQAIRDATRRLGIDLPTRRAYGRMRGSRGRPRRSRRAHRGTRQCPRWPRRGVAFPHSEGSRCGVGYRVPRAR